MNTRLLGVAAAVAATLAGLACAPDTGRDEARDAIERFDDDVADVVTADTAPTTLSSPTVPLPGETVARVIDGDTLVLASGATVRLIGIDTPERGDCGYASATQALRDLTVGGPVTLTAGATDDADRYGRLLRYVDTVDGRDAGLELIRLGEAIARYDSRDGYGAHPREGDYVAADATTPAACA
jgi:micrococcal nuclease